jgi:hypothetical protein
MNMSSGLFSDSLGVATAFVIRSLMEHPQRKTPEQIAGSSDEIDAEAARGALGELAARGIVAEDTEGRWRLTDAGRDVAQQA